MKNEPASRPKHALEHAPTVLHDEHEEDTLLARWLFRAMEKGTRFWLMVAGVAVLGGAILLLATTLSTGDPAKSAAWDELLKAKDADAQEKVAEAYPKSKAAAWARLQAAGTRFNEGVEKLATDRTAASPLLKKALDQYEEVFNASPKDSPQARLAALGMARSLEARNELKDAIEQYRKVAADWPGTDEATQAARQAELLARPESVEFYKQLYSYKPPEKTIPPSGKALFDSLGMPPGHPPIGPLPELPGGTIPGTGPIRTPDLDKLLGEPPPLAEPATDPAPKAAPAGESRPAEGSKAAELPGDPFTAPK